MSESSRKNIALDCSFAVVSLAALTCGWLSLYCDWYYLSWAPIVVTDLYMFAVIFTAAVRADKKKETYQCGWVADWLFPSRRAGVITIPLMVFALVLSFAGLYWGLPGEGNFTYDFSSRMDSLYFSLVTLTTVGYGDFAPLSESARELVIYEISSGFLVLIGAFPLLISRVSEF